MRKSDLEALRLLAEGDSVGASRIGEALLARLKDGDMVTATTRGSKVSYKAVRPQAIKEIFAGELSVADLPESVSRADLVAATGDSKAVHVRSCPGFPVNCYQPIHARMNGRTVIIAPDEGTFVFVSDFRNFTIHADVVVVGVENMENFRDVRAQRYLFANLEAPVLFVSRYPQSGDLVQWLQSIPNRYIHFGDLDLAGVNIYLTEFYNRLGDRASFFVPSDADERLARGSRERYDAQLPRFARMIVTDPRVQGLVDLIHHHKRGYDQEGFIDKLIGVLLR